MIRIDAQRFLKAQRGAVAVEFAVVALSFVLLLFGVLQFALFFLSRVAMHDSLSELATGDGAALLAAADRTKTRDYICEKLILSPDCTRLLKLEMRELRTAEPDTISTTFAAGPSATVMVVRAEAPILIFVPFIESISVRGKAVFLQPAGRAGGLS